MQTERRQLQTERWGLSPATTLRPRSDRCGLVPSPQGTSPALQLSTRTFAYAFAVAVAVAGIVTLCASSIALAAPPNAPIVLETSTRAFTPVWELALDDDGRVQRRIVPPKSATTATTWHLLPPGGVPVPSARIEVMKELIVPIVSRAFESATRLTQLSADGDNLIVVDDRKRVYYAKLGRDPSRVGTWADVWGPPALSAPLILPDDTIAWAISHRAQPYEDIDGNVHPISAGVTTLYGLFPGDDVGGQRSGSRIAYQDPWLPPPSTPGARWDREVCGPERGTLTLVSLAASASTIAVMDDAGRIFTRLADFDTLGHNPALPYSWRREKRVGLEENVRSLPPEEWRLQPSIPGEHERDITIFFDGEGNAKRTLRVAGAHGGATGYWEKALLDEKWHFVVVKGAQAPSPKTFAKRSEPTRHPPRGETLRTKINKADVVVEDFSLACPGARVTLSRDDEVVHLTLWHTDRLLELTPREHDLRGALFLEGNPKGKLADDVRTTFGGAMHEVEIDVSARIVEVKSAAADFQKMKRPLRVRLPRSRPATARE